MNKNLRPYIQQLEKEAPQIDLDRQKLLRLMGDLINDMLVQHGEIGINFICTHNSRRSQLAEAWMVAALQYYGMDGIHAYSGGTEATAFNIRMVVALRQKGFHLHTDGPRDNPKYVLQALQQQSKPHIMFSKVYDHPHNQQDHMIAVMVCDHADQNCPVVLGAEHRISMAFVDPKEYDDTPMEHDAYLDKVDEVGREIIYLVHQIQSPS